MKGLVGLLLVVPVVATAQLYVAHVDTVGRDPYGPTLWWGAGLVTDPVAWEPPSSGDVTLTFGGVRIPSVNHPVTNPVVYWNDNFSIDTYWLHRFDIGFSLYNNNPQWGFFGQVLLLRDGQFASFLPGIAVGFRNLGPYDHEDRYLLGYDITVDSAGRSHTFTPPNYDHFHTAPTLYAVATKEVLLDDEPLTFSSVSFTVGGGDGLFSDDGGLGNVYDYKGATVVRGLFFGAHAVAHPLSNTSVSLVLENDAWNWNAGAVIDWRGFSFGLYGMELGQGSRERPFTGFLVYNYEKLAATVGYHGNLGSIVHGQVLRSNIDDLQREQHHLRRELTQRRRRIDQLQAQLAALEKTSLGDIARRRAALQQQLQQEEDAIRHATDKLQQLQAAPR